MLAKIGPRLIDPEATTDAHVVTLAHWEDVEGIFQRRRILTKRGVSAHDIYYVTWDLSKDASEHTSGLRKHIRQVNCKGEV